MHRKKTTVAFLVPLFIFLLHSPTINCLEAPMHVNISPNITASPIFTPNYHNDFNPNITNNVYSFSYAIGTKIRDISLVWIQQIKELATEENYIIIKQLMKEMLWEHRYAITTGVLLSSYGTTNILLITDYYYLNNDSRWSRWKLKHSFEQLCAISQKDLAQELLLTIGERYYNEKNPIDLTHPLLRFITTIDTEIRVIKRYIAITKMIKKLRLFTIFSTSDDKINNAQQLLERALFVKHIFLSWLSEYNLTSSR